MADYTCPHLGARYYCDHCGAYDPTPQELEEWKKNYMSLQQLLDLLRSSLGPLDMWTEQRYVKTIPRFPFDGEPYFDREDVANWMTSLLNHSSRP